MWYVIQVINGREDVMRERIERVVPAGAMLELFYPQFQTEIKVHGEWVNTTKPLFPGYLICDTADPRTVQHYLLRMDDFARVLSQDGQFVPLAKEETQLIGNFTNRGDRVVPMSEALKDGDQVVVTAGLTHAYSEMYLEDAMRTLGEAVDFALCDQGLNPAELTAILSNAFEMKQFERGMPRVVCGMAGDELARDIIAHAGLSPVECRETYPFDRSPQYWAGWVLAYAQWMCSLGFNELLEVAPLDWIIGSYHPLHEAPEDKFVQIVIDKWNKAQAGKKGLKAARKAAGLTQKQLAAQSGVKLRAIQLYEQNQLDLRRASVSSALALANTLSCAIEDLVWQPVALEYDSRAITSVKL